MDIVIKIGRNATGKNVYGVSSTCSKVSRDHAIVRWHDGIATIEDTSTNGTFVNGQRITNAALTPNDTIWLGGSNPMDERNHQLDVRRIFELIQEARMAQEVKPAPVAQPYQEVSHVQNVSPIPAASPAQAVTPAVERTDYTKEFARVKKAYIDYHAAMSKLKKKAGMQMQLPRVFLSMIPAILGIVILLVAKDMTMRIVGMTAGSVLSGLIGTLTMGRSSSKQEEMAEKTLDLQLKYQKEYKCPKCGKEYSLDLHWKKLQADGQCPHGCGARFA